MDNETIIKVLRKAQVLRTFSYGSFPPLSFSEKEFYEVCSTLCENEILKKQQASPNEARGGRGNRRLIAFENPIEYTLINPDACNLLIEELSNESRKEILL